MSAPSEPLPMPTPPAKLRDRILDWRNRLVANPRFQLWAARFPLTRGIARRKAASLFNIAAGFIYSQVLGACVELRLFDRLREGSADVSELARECQLPEEAMRRLLLAADSIGLLDRRGEQFALGELGAAVLANPGVSAMIMHNRCLYRDLTDPVGLLRGEQPASLAEFWPYATGMEGDAARYSELMAASQSLVADDILDAVPMGDRRHLWDIAGGNGTFASHALQRWPGLCATVLDLPPVASLAEKNFASQGLDARARAFAGDMFNAPLADTEPTHFGPPDLVSLVRVVHDHNDDAVMTLLRGIRDAMAPGGKLVLAEPMAESAGAEPFGHAYFGLYLFAMGSGRPRTREELIEMVESAGFRNCREVHTHRPHMVRVLVAQT